MSVKSYRQMIGILLEQPVTPAFDDIAMLVHSAGAHSQTRRSGIITWLGIGVFLTLSLLPSELRLAGYRGHSSHSIANTSTMVVATAPKALDLMPCRFTQSAPKSLVEVSKAQTVELADASFGRISTTSPIRLHVVCDNRTKIVTFASITAPAVRTKSVLPLSIFALIGLSSSSALAQLPTFSAGVAYQLTDAFEISLELQQTYTIKSFRRGRNYHC